MFRTLVGLVAVSGMMVFTPAANAQRGGGGRGGGGGHSSVGHSSAGRSGGAAHFSGHPSTIHSGSMQHHTANFNNFHHFDDHHHHNGFWGFGLGFGLGYPYGYYNSGYYGYGYPSYDYYDEPYYNYSAPAYNYAPAVAPDMPPAEDRSAHIQVIVPEGAARVWFDGAATTSRGTIRYFDTPPLAPNNTFNYKVKASWVQDGQTMNDERVVQVRVGSRAVIDFTQPAPK